MHLNARAAWAMALTALATLPSPADAASSKNNKNAILLSKVSKVLSPPSHRV